MHVFITACVVLFPVLEWDNIHRVLVLLCIETDHLMTFFIAELHFRCPKSR